MEFPTGQMIAAVAFAAGLLATDMAAGAETYGRNKWMLCKPEGEQSGYMSGTTSATAFTPDGSRVAIAGEDRTVQVCETADGAVTATLAVPSALPEDDDYVDVVALSADGTYLATASRDRMIRLWDIAAGRELAAMEHPSPVYFAAFSPNGGHLVTSTGDGTILLFDIPAGREVATIRHPGVARTVAFSPDGARLVTASEDGSVHVWDMTGSRTASLSEPHDGRVYDAKFSPDGTRIATASHDRTARISDAATGNTLLTLAHPAPVSAVAFSADGARIVTGTHNHGIVFDAVSGAELVVLEGGDYAVNDAAFSADGSRIVTASSDQSVRVFDAASGEEIAVLTGHLIGVDTAAFTPDGQRIISIGGPEGALWTKLAASGLPAESAGLWFADFGTPEEPLPDEIVRHVCVASPIAIGGDGLVVFFEMMSDVDPPEAVIHMRCATDLSCQIFAGGPAQGIEEQGEGSVAFTGDTGSLCMNGECRPIARCPEIAWTDEERASGLAARWEAAVLAPGR